MPRPIRHAILTGIACLHLLSPMAPALAGTPEQDEANRQRFYESSYTPCDADALAVAWSLSLDDAKAQIGWKLDGGDPEQLERELAAARLAALDATSTCYFHERGGFSYEDAESLGIYWSVSVEEAKARIGFKVAVGESELVRNDLDAAETMLEKAAANAADEELDPNEGITHDGTDLMIAEEQRLDDEAYFASPYGYCDAQLLAGAWQVSLSEAKSRIGYKVRQGDEALLDEALGPARKASQARGEHCYIVYQEMVPDDEIEVLAKLWAVDARVVRDRLDDMIALRQQGELERARTQARAALGAAP